MYDFCVNGAGMVGATLALGLLRQGYRVALIDPAPPKPFEPAQPPDLRVSALSVGTVALLQSLGAWQSIPAGRLRAYNKLSVWEDRQSVTDFDAQLLDMSVLGYFCENRLIQLACLDAIARQQHEANLAQFTQAPKAIQWDEPHGCTVVLNDDSTIAARWLIGADGAGSFVRQQAGISTRGWQYGQQALGVTVKTAQAQPDWTWQEFHPSGPRAFLPMYDNFGSFVWYDSPARIRQLKTMNNTQLKQAIEDAFPRITGDFDIQAKAAFPLARMHAQCYVKHQAILVGDAAHTINPLAGQGVNIGFKDVQALLNVTQPNAGLLKYASLKEQYEQPRQRDNLAMMSAMDAFYLLFSNRLAPVKWLRTGMLKMTQHTDFAKRQILQYAIGG